MERRRHFEVWSEGIDEALQGISSDPYSGMVSMGLRVPTLVTESLASRYLFNCCGFEVPEGTNACITGIRTFASLGLRQTATGTPIFLEQEIITPNITSLPDGNVSWHLREISEKVNTKFTTRSQPGVPLQSTAFRFSKGPGLLYEAIDQPAGNPYYVNLAGYTPPNQGRPYGKSIGGLGNFHDLRFPWRLGWHDTRIPIAGPTFVAMFASVRQSAGLYTGPVVGSTFKATNVNPELSFILDFGTTAHDASTGVIIWRVGAALRVEFEEAA